jgi:hypothetical protein
LLLAPTASAFGAQRSFKFVIGGVAGGALQVPNFAVVTINNDATNAANSVDDASFFVRRHYSVISDVTRTISRTGTLRDTTTG